MLDKTFKKYVIMLLLAILHRSRGVAGFDDEEKLMRGALQYVKEL